MVISAYAIVRDNVTHCDHIYEDRKDAVKALRRLAKRLHEKYGYDILEDQSANEDRPRISVYGGAFIAHREELHLCTVRFHRKEGKA